jgi:oligopeptide/dipeptide ABC transporter ATP-binding protein
MSLLEVDNLSVAFTTESGDVPAVNGVSFHVDLGETVGLVGESGCGKSVTCMSILRLIPRPPGRFTSGAIRFDGKDLLTLPTPELRRIRGNDISMIFQEPMTALSPLMTIGRQMIEGLRVHRPEMSKADAMKTAGDWLAKVGIPDAHDRLGNFPFQLSGGMRQRVMIAMALMLHPRLIIADEPTTALDVTIQAQVFDLIREMKSADTSLLLVTHDMGVVWDTCDRVVVMYASQVVEEGPVDTIFREPRHPYTQGLLAAVPRLSGDQTRLEAIDGQVPAPADYPNGCHFADRCPHVMDICRQTDPGRTAIPAGGSVRCHKVAQDLAQAKESGAE